MNRAPATYNEAIRLRNTARYRRMRRKHLAKHPLCVECAANGLTVAATDLDHIVPVHIDPEKFWEADNLQGLCRECHSKKTAEENMARNGRTKPHLEDDFNAELAELVKEISEGDGI